MLLTIGGSIIKSAFILTCFTRFLRVDKEYLPWQTHCYKFPFLHHNMQHFRSLLRRRANIPETVYKSRLLPLFGESWRQERIDVINKYVWYDNDFTQHSPSLSYGPFITTCSSVHFPHLGDLGAWRLKLKRLDKKLHQVLTSIRHLKDVLIISFCLSVGVFPAKMRLWAPNTTVNVIHDKSWET